MTPFFKSWLQFTWSEPQVSSYIQRSGNNYILYLNLVLLCMCDNLVLWNGHPSLQSDPKFLSGSSTHNKKITTTTGNIFIVRGISSPPPPHTHKRIRPPQVRLTSNLVRLSNADWGNNETMYCCHDALWHICGVFKLPVTNGKDSSPIWTLPHGKVVNAVCSVCLTRGEGGGGHSENILVGCALVHKKGVLGAGTTRKKGEGLRNWSCKKRAS